MHHSDVVILWDFSKRFCNFSVYAFIHCHIPFWGPFTMIWNLLSDLLHTMELSLMTTKSSSSLYLVTQTWTIFFSHNNMHFCFSAWCICKCFPVVFCKPSSHRQFLLALAFSLSNTSSFSLPSKTYNVTWAVNSLIKSTSQPKCHLVNLLCTSIDPFLTKAQCPV